MSRLLAQLPALLGVVVGALATLATTRAADRARWNREMRTRWDAQRLDAYRQYAGTLKDLSVLAHRATARKRPGARSEPIDAEEVGRLYAAAPSRRSERKGARCRHRRRAPSVPRSPVEEPRAHTS
ncbi:hypothetical protein [Nonomuraea sp. NPDC005692]|uniref:hypothetical protein n=1 Tax=Nonomuraea sp. NPDC005692 TaxID=3157168 RepID=UPI0033F3A9E1